MSLIALNSIRGAVSVAAEMLANAQLQLASLGPTFGAEAVTEQAKSLSDMAEGLKSRVAVITRAALTPVENEASEPVSTGNEAETASNPSSGEPAPASDTAQVDEKAPNQGPETDETPVSEPEAAPAQVEEPAPEAPASGTTTVGEIRIGV